MSGPQILRNCTVEPESRRAPTHAELPFGDDNALHAVQHVEHVTYAVAEFADRPRVGTIAMLYGLRGLYAAYDSAGLRSVAQALLSMADEIDAKSATRQ